MKKTILVSSLSVAFAMMSGVAQADYPRVVIDSDIVLNYDQEIDMTGAVNVPTVEINEVGSNVVTQNNHDATIEATGVVNYNSNLQGDINVTVSAIGNNAAIDVDDYATIGAVQGNQNTSISAYGGIVGNRIGNVETALNVTAVGNNLSIAKTEIDDEDTSAAVGAVQFNYGTSVEASGEITGNNFGVPRDPAITVAAIGNNFKSFDGVLSSNTQLNVGSSITATGAFTANTGNIGPIDVSVTAVGNNLAIKLPSEN